MDHCRAPKPPGDPRSRSADATGQREDAQDRRHRSPRGPARRVETDVSRGLAHRARFLLRSATTTVSTWRPPRSATSPIWTTSHRGADLNYLFTEMLGEHHGWPHVRRRRRLAGGEARADRAARRGLQDRERPLSLRASLQRRELESGAEGAAHAAGRQRRGRRLPAGRERAANCARPTTSTASSKARPASRWC